MSVLNVTAYHEAMAADRVLTAVIALTFSDETQRLAALIRAKSHVLSAAQASLGLADGDGKVGLVAVVAAAHRAAVALNGSTPVAAHAALEHALALSRSVLSAARDLALLEVRDPARYHQAAVAFARLAVLVGDPGGPQARGPTVAATPSPDPHPN